MHVLNACAGVEPQRLVMISTTLVYGAHPKNPNFLTEDAELRGHRDSRFVNDKVRAERQVQRFAKEHPGRRGLRAAVRADPRARRVSNMYTRFFSRPVAPVMMGHDPLMQFVHEQDAAWALAARGRLARDRRVQHRRQGRPAVHDRARAARPRAGADAADRRAPAHEGAVGDPARRLAAELPRFPALPLRRRRRARRAASSGSRRACRSSARSSTSSASPRRTARPTSRGRMRMTDDDDDPT